MPNTETEVVYPGQFGSFTITDRDRQGVLVYRAGLALSAASFAIASLWILWQGAQPAVLTELNGLYLLFCLGLGISLLTIHIYLLPLHRLLQVFWGIGVCASCGLAFYYSGDWIARVYEQPLTLLGVGFVFAALTGIYFKEAFCFQRLETKVLTFLVPVLLLGHLLQVLPVTVERSLLGIWAALYFVFALRKCIQAIPPDIGDKSVFTYLQAQRRGQPVVTE